MAKQKVGLPAATAGVQAWRSRPTPAQKGPQQGKQQGISKRGRNAYTRDLLRLLVPAVTFVAMTAPENEGVTDN